MTKTSIILLTGFLGAGKTSVLNHLMTVLPHAGSPDRPDPVRLGVIVNEFGKASIDAPVVSGHGFQVAELNNGSIFCQCLAGTFVDSMARMLEFDLDYLLIESSGLADPANMKDMVGQLDKKTSRPYTYAGAICVIDAKYFRKLSQSLDTINRQILAASLVVINKADLVESETLEAVRSSVRRLNPMANVVSTTFGQIDPAELARLRRSRLRPLPSLNTPGNRPVTSLLLTDDLLDTKKLQQFAEALQSGVYRIKGLVRTEAGFCRLDVIGQEIRLDPVNLTGERSEIVILAPREALSPDTIRQLADEILGVKATWG
ncbi:MAG: CobW family GTP-binding protein [Clostridiales bacterium]|nr:CobW family GTP-binding protein [Clostridiales bacterium]